MTESLTVRAAFLENLRQVERTVLEGQRVLEEEQQTNRLLRAALEDAYKEIERLTAALVGKVYR